MSVNPRIETEEDVQLIKDYTLLPILLDMLARDRQELAIYNDKIVYHHLLLYLSEIEKAIYAELQRIKHGMKKRDIKVLGTEMNSLGVHVEYNVRGYIHHFTMFRNLIKAELMTILLHLRRRLK